MICIPFRCIVSRSLSLSESAFALAEDMRIFRRDTVGELSLEFVSGALLSILVKPKDENIEFYCNVIDMNSLYRWIFVWMFVLNLNIEI